MELRSSTFLFLICASANALSYSHSSPGNGTTSSQLAADLRGTPTVPKADQAPEVLYRQRHAEGYLAGVMDATQGIVWCRPARLKPGEINELVWTALATETRRVNEGAAERIVQILRSKFPCSRSTS